MPANVESMFSVRQMPWHREGTILADYPGSWTEARKAAGLDWDPVTAPVYQLTGFEDPGSLSLGTFGDVPGGVPVYEEVPGFNIIKRSDTGAILAIKADSYTVIDHGEMGEIVEAVLAQPGVKWETAGSLDGGRKVWCLAYLDEPVTLPGDKSVTLPYIGITNPHDGSGACAVRATSVRVVCWNTYSAAEAEGERTGTVFRFIHRSNWRDRIDEAREAVTGARTAIAEYTKMAEHLLGIKVTTEQKNLFVKAFIPAPPDTLISDRVARNIEEARNAVHGFLSSPSSEGIEGTAFWLVQGAGEYLDHGRAAQSWGSHLNRTLLRPEPLKRKAVQLVEEIVGV